ncbi:HAMP domain-containing sensor histidine kinase [Rhizobium halophytocola]|uniref:histidine kinase n=1 Tax=Rhizobium halophytocola TaxID=735519 RepID=A0ABS4E4J2_9HYPH|nr:HAMP domain-containing sensor histidine kinase [Rhizobium halophytocola]MBP1852870.1 signal transduction histidine kinase [Rhizobium halophytocola]
MHKLFLKAFFVTWLAMSVSIGFVLGVATLTSRLPSLTDLNEREAKLVLSSASELLRKHGLSAAQTFTNSLDRTSSSAELNIARVPVTVDCVEDLNDRWSRIVVSRGDCYRLSAKPADSSMANWFFPRTLPWLSALLAAVGAALWLARYLTEPVQLLKDGLRALAQGQFSVRIGQRIGQKSDEVAALAHDFDRTAARLEEFHDVQRRLFHDVSHELRSPLSRMQAAIGLLRMNPARMGAMVERLEREIARIDDLVDEILTLARLNAGVPGVLQFQTVDLVDLIMEIIENSEFESASKNISIEYAGLSSYVMTVNGELIYRAVENVVRNALKYCPERASVRVSTSSQEERFAITIEDDGPGVPEDMLEHIFRPFERAGAKTDVPTGFGLGLSITKRAIHVHGGDVEARVNAAGGLAVRLLIPVVQKRT